MDFLQELKQEKEIIENTLKIIRYNPVFINEEVSELEMELKRLDSLLKIIKE